MAPTGAVLLVCVTVVVGVLERNSRGHVDGSYLNQWAAHIPGGRDVAQRVASELGYVNHGQVSNAELPVVLQSGVFRT